MFLHLYQRVPIQIKHCSDLMPGPGGQTQGQLQPRRVGKRPWAPAGCNFIWLWRQFGIWNHGAKSETIPLWSGWSDMLGVSPYQLVKESNAIDFLPPPSLCLFPLPPSSPLFPPLKYLFFSVWLIFSLLKLFLSRAISLWISLSL